MTAITINTAMRAREDQFDAPKYAHPVDQAIINVLKTPIVRRTFEAYVNLTTKVQHGIIKAQGLMINRQSFPDTHDKLMTCCQTLGIDIPHTVIHEGMIGVSAYTTGVDEAATVVLSTLLQRMLPPEEQMFIIGHECGHIALRHVVYHTAAQSIALLASHAPAMGSMMKLAIVPLNAWVRCSEITADRAGLLCCGNLEVAKRALLRTVSGFTDIGNLDLDAYIRQSCDTYKAQGVGRFMELFNRHPVLYKRLKALELFAQSELHYEITGHYALEPEDGLVCTAALNRKVNALLNVTDGGVSFTS